LQLRERDQTED